MTVLQPLQPYPPTFFENLKRVGDVPVQKSVGEAGCTGCKIFRSAYGQEATQKDDAKSFKERRQSISRPNKNSFRFDMDRLEMRN